MRHHVSIRYLSICTLTIIFNAVALEKPGALGPGAREDESSSSSEVSEEMTLSSKEKRAVEDSIYTMTNKEGERTIHNKFDIPANLERLAALEGKGKVDLSAAGLKHPLGPATMYRLKAKGWVSSHSDNRYSLTNKGRYALELLREEINSEEVEDEVTRKRSRQDREDEDEDEDEARDLPPGNDHLDFAGKSYFVMAPDDFQKLLVEKFDQVLTSTLHDPATIRRFEQAAFARIKEQIQAQPAFKKVQLGADFDELLRRKISVSIGPRE